MVSLAGIGNEQLVRRAQIGFDEKVLQGAPVEVELVDGLLLFLGGSLIIEHVDLHIPVYADRGIDSVSEEHDFADESPAGKAIHSGSFTWFPQADHFIDRVFGRCDGQGIEFRLSPGKHLLAAG